MFKMTGWAFFIGFFCVSALAQQEISENTVIINNEVQESSSNNIEISAPSLVPSSAGKLRSLREKQEVQTEDSILQELEKQRLLDEQKRLDSLMGTGQNDLLEPSPVEAVPSAPSVKPSFSLLQYAYMSFGGGLMHYPGAENVNTQSFPSGFLSFGTYQKPFDINFSGFYARAIIRPVDQQKARMRVDEPGLSATVKFSVIDTGRAKAYVGGTGVVVARKYTWINIDGTSLDNPSQPKTRDVSQRQWWFSTYVGGAVGLDIALAKRLGLNLEVKYYVGLTTENRKTQVEENNKLDLLDERDTISVSLSGKYFF